MDFFDLFNEVNLQNIDNIVIYPEELENVNNLSKRLKNTLNDEIQQGSGPTSAARGYDSTERGRGAGRRYRGNHREL